METKNNSNPAGPTLKLAKYISQNHPDRIFKEGKKAIEQYCIDKIEAANDIYAAKLSTGLNEDCAWEFANELIYSGLLFSKYNVVNEIHARLSRSNINIVDPSDAHKIFICELIEKCEAVFEQFKVNDTTAIDDELEQALSPIILASIYLPN